MLLGMIRCKLSSLSQNTVGLQAWMLAVPVNGEEGGLTLILSARINIGNCDFLGLSETVNFWVFQLVS